MKLLMIIVCFLMLETFAIPDIHGEVDLFGGLESFVEKDTFIFASCEKFTESFEKVCVIKKFSNIFNVASSITCSAILESQRRDYVIGPKIKIIPFGDTRAIVKWLEKYEGASNAQRIFVRFTIIKFDNCSRRDVDFFLPLMNDENPDNSFNDVYVVTNEANHYFLVIFYNEYMCKRKICKVAFDDEGNKIQELEPWFSIKNEVIKEFVPFKPGHVEFGFVAFSDFPETYLVDESGTKALKLDIYSAANSKIIYSTHHDSISFCYYVDSSFSCARFTYDGKPKVKRRFRLDWQIVDSAVHYVPEYGILVFTYSDSESCKETEVQEHITLINDQGLVESVDLQCRLRSLTMPQCFYNDNNEYCLFEYVFNMADGEKLLHRLRCFLVQSTGDVLSDISKMLNAVNSQISHIEKE